MKHTFKCFVCLLLDLWRPSSSTSDGLRNGDMCSSSLAAKGYRSVRPNFQDKKSPTPVRSAVFTSLICFSYPFCRWGFSFRRKRLWKSIRQVLLMTFLTVQVTPFSSVLLSLKTKHKANLSTDLNESQYYYWLWENWLLIMCLFVLFWSEACWMCTLPKKFISISFPATENWWINII